jgi:RHS repeat-associated protein
MIEWRVCWRLVTTRMDADLLRRHLFTYDRAHNQLSESVALNGGAPTVTNRTYNAANQISSAGFTYDNNGNLTSDGAYTHTWDRANRLVRRSNVTGGSGLQAEYEYDALGNRYRRTDTVFAGSLAEFTTSSFLMDVAGGLPRVIRENLDASVTRYVHSPMGIFAQKDNSNAWEWMLGDGLGSLRSMADNTGAPLWAGNYAPYGTPFGEVGTDQTSYGFTGEQSDPNGLVYLRARYHSPSLGQFLNLDPLETFNRYGYVDGNVINRVDPSGLLMMFRRSRYDDDAPVRKVVVTPPAAPKPWSPVKVSSWKPTTVKPSVPASSSSSGSVKGVGSTQVHIGVSAPSSSGKLQKSPSSASSPTGTGMRSMGSSSSASSPTGKGMGSLRSTSLVSPSTGTGVRSLRSPSSNSGGSSYSVDRMRQALQGTSGRGSNSPSRLTSGDSGGLLPEPCGTDVLCLTPSPDFGTSVSPGDFTPFSWGDTPDFTGFLGSTGRSQEFPNSLIPNNRGGDEGQVIIILPGLVPELQNDRKTRAECDREYYECSDGCDILYPGPEDEPEHRFCIVLCMVEWAECLS